MAREELKMLKIAIWDQTLFVCTVARGSVVITGSLSPIYFFVNSSVLTWNVLIPAHKWNFISWDNHFMWDEVIVRCCFSPLQQQQQQFSVDSSMQKQSLQLKTSELFSTSTTTDTTTTRRFLMQLYFPNETGHFISNYNLVKWDVWIILT